VKKLSPPLIEMLDERRVIALCAAISVVLVGCLFWLLVR